MSIRQARPSPVYTCQEACPHFLLASLHVDEGSLIKNHGAYIQSQCRWAYVGCTLHTAALGLDAEVYCNITYTTGNFTFCKKNHISGRNGLKYQHFVHFILCECTYLLTYLLTYSMEQSPS
jgi:hypothetical protein